MQRGTRPWLSAVTEKLTFWSGHYSLQLLRLRPFHMETIKRQNAYHNKGMRKKDQEIQADWIILLKWIPYLLQVIITNLRLVLPPENRHDWIADFLMQPQRKNSVYWLIHNLGPEWKKKKSHFICVQDGRSLKIMNYKSGHNWKLQINENQIGMQNNIVRVYFSKSKGKMQMCMEGHPQRLQILLEIGLSATGEKRRG